MSKKKKSDSNFRDANVPEQINMDDLALMSDDELSQRASLCENERNRTWNQAPWEIEIAYVRREQQIRRTGTDMHQEYLKRHPQESNDSESYDEVTQ
jgi:uncharacterized small protein (DUF1192 family)